MISRRSFKPKVIFAWLILLLICVSAFLVLFFPLMIGDPSRVQTSSDLSRAHFLTSNAPYLVITFLVLSIALAVWIWRHSLKYVSKGLLIIPLLLMLAFVWVAYQHPMEWMFRPLETTAYASSADVDFVKADEMVMAVEKNGEAVAYPVRQMLYHHIVHDTVGATPVVSTY